MKIKHLLFSIFCFSILCEYTQAQSLNFSWARQMNDAGIVISFFANLTNIGSVEDAQGNIYVVNEYATSHLHSDAYLDILKYNSLGLLIWRKTIGKGVRGGDIAMDSKQNIYVVGYFTGTVDFDSGDSVYNVSSTNVSFDAFIQKLDTAGHLIWIQSTDGSGDERYLSVSTDTRDNIYLTGVFEDSVDFDPSDSVYTLFSKGLNDIFVQKLDSLGNFVWAKAFGGENFDNGYAIDVDSAFNVYVAGSFQSTVDFDTGDSIYNLSSNGSHDIFIQKLDSMGNFVWTKSFGAEQTDGLLAMCMDNRFNIYVTGHFMSTVDFDPGDSVYNISSNGNSDIFVQKLDSDGNFLWVKSVGGSGVDLGRDVYVRGQYIYVTGDFHETVDFDPGNAVHTLSSNGDRDIFIQKLDSMGNFFWAKSMGGSDWNGGFSVLVSEDCAVYTLGLFRGTVDFSGGIDTNAIYTSTQYRANGFITKHTQDYTAYTTASDTVFACNSYVFQDSTYTSSTELYTDTVCGVITTYYLSILQSIEVMDTVSTCESFVWGDSTYRHTGVYQDTLQRTNTCDSVVALTLSIHNSSTGDTTLVSCDSVRFAGMVYTASGMYQDTLIGSNGCDSIISVALTIIDSVDTFVIQEDSRLVARLEGVEYQWLDCGNSYAEIEGATNRIFTANTNGEYAVEITDVCIDTSSCYTVMGLSIEALREPQGPLGIHIYPSPTEGEMFIELGQFSERVFVVVRDVFGRVLQEEVLSTGSMTNRINTRLETSAGMYYIEVSDDKGNRGVFRVVKQ